MTTPWLGRWPQCATGLMLTGLSQVCSTCLSAQRASSFGWSFIVRARQPLSPAPLTPTWLERMDRALPDDAGEAAERAQPAGRGLRVSMFAVPLTVPARGRSRFLRQWHGSSAREDHGTGAGMLRHRRSDRRRDVLATTDRWF